MAFWSHFTSKYKEVLGLKRLKVYMAFNRQEVTAAGTISFYKWRLRILLNPDFGLFKVLLHILKVSLFSFESS